MHPELIPKKPLGRRVVVPASRKNPSFLKWLAGLLAPDFVSDGPGLRDNLRLLRTHPRFKPLRMAVAAYTIFALTLGLGALYLLQNATPSAAAGDILIKTGYYIGNLNSKSITGLGFAPEMVIITGNGAIVWKSSVMPDDVVAYFSGSADNTEAQITLDADGFTVSATPDINNATGHYTYIAFAGSDCTASGVMCLGSYMGNGSTTQVISTGFQPDMAWVKRTTGVAGTFRTSAMLDNHSASLAGIANDTTGVYFRTLDSNGFTVGATNNTYASVFYYATFKNLAGKLSVGSFTGNGADNRDITGLGFEPDLVIIKQSNATTLALNVTEHYGDVTKFASTNSAQVNAIQELQADGFQVGNNTNTNVTGLPNYYLAIGGSPDPTPSGTFLMQKGSYTGTGVDQDINTPFAPDLVIIKAATAELSVFAVTTGNNAITQYNYTQYTGSASAQIPNGITGMDQDSFSVGTHSTVNTQGITYEYVVFGNATTPYRQDGAADLVIGNYIGTGISPRPIDHLGIAPNFVYAKRDNNYIGMWRTSSMANNAGSFMSITADITDGTAFRTLDADGFTLGSFTNVNTAGFTHAFFAFKEGAGAFDVGSYLGNGVATTSITGLGFDPDWVLTKKTNGNPIHRSTSPTITGFYSQYFSNAANALNLIIGFVADGFTLGNSADVNGNGSTYHYAAWNGTSSANVPATPTHSSPADGAIAQGVDATLTSSAYSDPDGNPQTSAQWQVDDDSSFSTPVWSRTSAGAEFTTSVTAANGAFANELAGEAELDHNSVYYWRVRHSDGAWSEWSTGTSFTTNVISTPTNSSPVDAATVTTLTPTLTASALSDEQGSHTASSSEWQIHTSNSFSSPLYDSGAVGYGASFAVPSATLSNQAAYYWRVRYQDSGGQWSPYSTATRFLVQESSVVVTPVFGGTVVDQGDNVSIDAQVKLADGTVVNNAAATVSVYNPSGTKIVDGASMPYLSGSGGVYRYPYTVPAVSGSYLYEVTAVSSSVSGYGAANFEVRTISADVSDIQATTSDTRSRVVDVQASLTNVQNNLDILIGAMVVTQSTVNDVSPSATSFVTALTNSTNDFYKNAVLTFTAGNLDGQSRRVSAYDGATKRITLEPALTSAPANSDAFTIVAQNVRVEEQVAEHETAEASFRADTTSRLANIESKIDTITSNLNTVDANLDSVLSTVNSIRVSQQKSYRATLSDVSEIQPESDYRAKLTLLDFESNPADASVTPTLVIYDATRGVAQASVDMTRLSAGVYEYVFPVPASSTAGLWETIVNVDVAGTADIVANDYWQVTGAPAQVLINSISDWSVPSITANATITNEGGAPYEYQYEWCVVSSQSNQCGGGDDVYHASAAKLIDAGDSYNPVLTATVPNTGDYWFKMIVYYGTEASGASRTFTAVTESGSSGGGQDSGGSVEGGGVSFATQENIYSEIIKARNDLELQSQKLIRTLEILGTVSPGLQELLEINSLNTENLIDIQNKVADLRAVSSATRRIVEQKTVEPVVETYMKFNSVEIHFLITNPDSTEQTVKFKAFLPQEAKPEHILNLNGLKIDYDTNASAYYVSGDITLGPNETVTRKVEMKDIWVFSEEEVKSLKQQAADLLPVISGTQYGSQGTILKNDIDSTLNIILLRQGESYSSPQDHIIAYRENKERMTRVESNLDKMKDLVVQAGASRGVVGQVGGIQTFATWGIIIVIVFGFGLLAAVVFAMWRHQTMLAAVAMGGTGAAGVAAQLGGTKLPQQYLVPKNQIGTLNLPWMKILIWIAISVLAVIVVIGLIEFGPSIMNSREIQFEVEK